MPTLAGHFAVDEKTFVSFIEKHPEVRFIFVQWLDYLGQMRTRCLPTAQFLKLIQKKQAIRISNGNLGTLQNDHMTPVCDPVGTICVSFDFWLPSLRLMQRVGLIKTAATVMGKICEESGAPHELSPREWLGVQILRFREEFMVDFLVGFEIEITFCKRNKDNPDLFEPLDSTHAWGTFTDEQYTESIPLMLIITTALQEMGIEVTTMHSEAGAGQYEFVLPPLAPIPAIDTLIQAKQCIMQIATTRGLRATCHPTPFPGIGTAAHAHISFNRDGNQMEALEWMEKSFMAAILEHLPGLCAFTMPQAASYGRVIDDSWTGGTWIAWGEQNREVPLRRSGYIQWEVRCLDGFANMYLAIYAIMAVGLYGMRKKMEMKLKDCRSQFCLSPFTNQHCCITNVDTESRQPVKALDRRAREAGYHKEASNVHRASSQSSSER
jgi:glutamine synthetase